MWGLGGLLLFQSGVFFCFIAVWIVVFASYGNVEMDVTKELTANPKVHVFEEGFRFVAFREEGKDIFRFEETETGEVMSELILNRDKAEQMLLPIPVSEGRGWVEYRDGSKWACALRFPDESSAVKGKCVRYEPLVGDDGRVIVKREEYDKRGVKLK